MSSSPRYALSHDVAFSRSQVWNLLAHTDRLNRQIGMGAVVYEDPATDEFGIYRPARAKLAGCLTNWREYLFHWEQDTRYTVVRRYDNGPLAHFEGGLELEDLGENRTRLTLWNRVTPRNRAAGVIVPIVARQLLQRAMRLCQIAFIEGEPPPLPQSPPPHARDWNRSALESGIARLCKMPIEESYALELQNFIASAGEDEVTALRPFEWADARGLNRHQALRTCLYAVRVGLLNLRWAMMCPNCRVSKDEVASLSQVGETVHCELCGVNYDLNFDRYVELRFAVHPKVRVASSAVYCIGGPFRTPHVIEQMTVAPHQTQSFNLKHQTPVRLRVIGLNHSIDVDETDAGTRFTLSAGGWKASNCSGSAQESAPHLCIENATKKPFAVVIEKRDWDSLAATAAHVTALQEFRDLFSSEVLAPGRQVAVESVTLFFSDLSNSTALYEKIGDAPAYSRVGSHFEFLTRNITEGGGAVVKTMGDAVMAVFNRPEDAVATAIKVQREFRDFAETLSDKGDVTLKIGLHCGPVLAVNSNDRLDYFGRTVNLAARAVGVSNGGDIILTGEVWEVPEVKALIEDQNLRTQQFQTILRGVEASRELVRVQA